MSFVTTFLQRWTRKKSFIFKGVILLLLYNNISTNFNEYYDSGLQPPKSARNLTHVEHLGAMNYASAELVNVTSKHEEGVWKEMKILCFMTSHLSESHIDALKNCWPKFLNKVSMLRNSDLLIFANSDNDTLTELTLGQDSDLMKNVLSKFNSVKIVTHRNDDDLGTENPTYYVDKKQAGASLPMELAYANGWFDGYDWVYRVNPDVIIRDDTFFKKAFSNSSVDGVFIQCSPEWIHTDFFAVRPNVIQPNSFSFQGKYYSAESQAEVEFRPIINSGRFMWVEGATPIVPRICRVVGDPIIHDHDFIEEQCPSNFTPDPSYYLDSEDSESSGEEELDNELNDS